MNATTETTRQDEKPTREQIAQAEFIEDSKNLFMAWREAGKPHKR